MDVVAYTLKMYNDMLYRDCTIEIPEQAESLEYAKRCSCDCCHGNFPVERMEVIYLVRAKDRNILDILDLCEWCFQREYQYFLLMETAEKL